MPRFARYFEESKEGNDVYIGGRVRACFNIPKHFTPFPQTPNPSIACAFASTPCRAEDCGQCSGIAEGKVLGWQRARLWDLLIFLILKMPRFARYFEESKEGNDVYIGGRVRACFNIPKRFTPFPQTPNPSIACALASTPCRAEGCGQCSGMAEGKALGSFNIFNPQDASALPRYFEESKEGNDVCIGGRVRACFNIPKHFTPFPQTPNPSIACAFASTPCRAEDCGQCSGIAEGKALGWQRARLWDLLIFLILKMPRFARYFEESKEGNDVYIGERVKACFNIPKRFTPFPQAPNPSTACALASTPCKAEGCGQGSGMGAMTPLAIIS